MLLLSMEFSRQEYWNRLPLPTLGDFPEPGFKPEPLASPALAGGFFTIGTTWAAQMLCVHMWNYNMHIIIFIICILYMCMYIIYIIFIICIQRNIHNPPRSHALVKSLSSADHTDKEFKLLD